MRIVVAIHDRPVWAIDDDDVRRLADALPGVEVVHVRDEAGRREIADADVLFAYRLSPAEFEGARRLQWIHSPAVGVGGLLTPGLIESPVVITNSRGVHSEAIAEHALALALALRRRLHSAVRRQMAHEWAQAEIAGHRGPVLSGTRLLVVGLGSIGGRVAALGAALGMRVSGVRRREGGPPPPGVERLVSAASLRDELGQADLVVLAAPLTSATHGLIKRADLEAMKPSAVLVNVGRGELVDEQALKEVLSTGRIDAGLDAFHQEPLPRDHFLWDLPNVLITPHTAPWSGDYWPPVTDLFLGNIGRFQRGDPLLNPVDKRAGY
jgi:phosphoglycerate dehydrogenase-like enzyme